jgi:hypothetical protein
MSDRAPRTLELAEPSHARRKLYLADRFQYFVIK